MQHCDKVMKETGEDWKINAVISQLTSEEVSLSVADGMGWNVIFETEPNKVGWIRSGNIELTLGLVGPLVLIGFGA